MARFLSTSATSYVLEELIKQSSEWLILISPYLRFSDRIKELISDTGHRQLNVEVVYGKNEAQAKELAWLSDLPLVRARFCKNLHAKCYINERRCIITSMNLHEFSQVHNNEMGVLLRKSEDANAYQEACEEARRIVRISEELRATKVPEQSDGKLSSSKMAKKLGMKTDALLDRLVWLGFLELRDGRHYLTEAGEKAGGEFRKSRHGPYFLWPDDLDLK